MRDAEADDGAGAPRATDAPKGDGARIRRLVPGEERALEAVMRRSFGGLAGVRFGPGTVAFVAEMEGRIVGGATLGAFRIDAARRGGVVKWLFTLPEARGHGVAAALVERALAWFDQEGVTDAFACVEGLNAGSSNRFAQHGFAPLGFVEQLRRYGAALPRVWLRTNHLIDVGHVLWARTPAARDAAPGLGLGGLAATLALLVALGVVAFARQGATVDATLVAGLAVAVAAAVGVRTGAMAIVGAASGLRLRFLAWETGLVLAAAIAVLFGGMFVVPGGLVPQARNWSTSAWRSGLARMAFAGATAVLALGWLAWWAVSAGVAPDVAPRVLLYARMLATFDVLLPFFPMTAFSGRRLLDASRPGWAALAAGTVGLWLVTLLP